MRNTRVINLFGGPGIGKTKTMFDIAAFMKSRGTLIEIAPEYAKTVVWEGNLELLKDQLTIFAMQYRSVNRLYGKVDYIITDSPLLLSLAYGPLNNSGLPESFYELVVDTHNMFNSINIILPRNENIAYEQEGRVQSESESKEIDKLINKLVISNTKLDLDHEILIPKSPDTTLTELIELVNKHETNS